MTGKIGMAGRWFGRRRGGPLGAALWVSLSTAAAGWAQVPNEPPYFAIEGARLVTVSGETVENGTLIIAHGVIEALGTGVEIPPEAWVIDGRGLTVYPGLIDSLTTLGLSTGEEGGGGRGGASSPGGDGPRPPAQLSRGPQDRPDSTPWVNGADRLATDDPRLKSWRESGFTSAISAPDQGIFPGQAAVINLGGERPRDMVVATPVALRINLTRARGRTFPSSLMGVIAYVRQVFLDTQWYDQAGEAYRIRPQGQERPRYDRALEPIGHVQELGLPVLVPGNRSREIDRGLRLGAELGFNTLIYGAHQGYESAHLLAEREAAALVSLKWPEEERNADPERDVPLRLLQFRQRAPSTPRVLHDAGVRFAFYSDGISNPKEFLANVRKAVEAGLPGDAAIKALTLAPAEIYGVADRLGSLERGKIANLVVADGEPWGEKTKVKMVFVDGRKYELREAARPKEAPAADVTGTWEVSLDGPRGVTESTLVLAMDKDGSLSGDVTSPRGTSRIADGWVSGSELSFTVTLGGGRRSMEASYTAEVEGETLRGTASFGSRSMAFSARRTQGAETAVTETVAAAEAVPVPALEPVVPQPAPPVTVIRNATLLTLTRGTVENGSILIRDGKIARVGRNLRIPRDARVIDATDQYVLPGIIDAHSHIAVDQGVNEGSLAVSALVGIEDVLNPTDISIYRALAGGVTSANILHGSSNPIGGKNAVIKLRWGGDAQGLLFEGAPPGIKFALGENPKRSNFRPPPGTPQRYPATRMGVIDVIRQAFTEARQYRADWKRYRSRLTAGEKNLIPPRRDLKLETLVEILEGKRLVHAHSYRADEILQLLRLAEEFGFSIATLQHVLEGYKVAKEIAEHGAGASTFSDWWGYKVEAYDAIPHNAALMTEKGVVVSINSDSAEEMRHLNQEAAKTVKWGGLSETEALKLVTLNPAKQLGIDHRVGSIEAGKDADLVIFDAHPLSVYARVQKTLIDGRVYFDRQEDLARRKTLEEAKKALSKPDKPEDRPPTEEQPSGQISPVSSPEVNP